MFALSNLLFLIFSCCALIDKRKPITGMGYLEFVMGKKIEFNKTVTLPKGELVFIRDACFQLQEDTQVLGSDEALFRALSKGDEQNVYVKNTLNSKFSAVDDWDESPLVLEGELKLRVMQALYAGEFEAVHNWAGKEDTCTNTAKAYISPVIEELEKMRDAKT